MPTAHAVLTPSWVQSVEGLDPDLRQHVFDALPDIVNGHPGVNEQGVQGTDLVTLEVGHTPVRIVAKRSNDVLRLLHVAAETEAVAWARAAPVELPPEKPPVQASPPEVAPPPAAPAASFVAPPGPLARYRNRDFRRFGIAPALADTLRGLTTDPDILAVVEPLQPHVAEAVLSLATDEALDVVERRYVEAAARLQRAETFLHSTAGEVEAAIQGGRWEIYLHPQQRRAVQARFKGAAKVTGGPGTGKSVVAVHRAHHLAEQVSASEPRPVLLCCPIPGPVGMLQRMVRQRCQDSPSLVQHIEVRSLSQVAKGILDAAGTPRIEASAEMLDRCWQRAMAAQGALDWPRAQYEAERVQVLDRNGAWSWEDYRFTPRQGRGTALDEGKRQQAWQVLTAFEAALAEERAADPITMAREATIALQGGLPSPWFAVVCDEVQDASASQLRLMAALARDPETREIRPDGLMLCGDGYQRVYAHPVELVRCGIEVRGRSSTLRLSYRTTEGIRQAALAEVRDLDADPLDAPERPDQDGTLDGYRSLRGGFPPIRELFATAGDEVAFIRDAWLEEGPMLVLARTEAYRDQLARALTAEGLDVSVLTEQEGGEPHPQGITVSTIHRAKGLEAPRVVLAGAQLLPLPYAGAKQPTDSELRWWERRERCLAYVAMTRARDWLAITRVS
ncbi:MAG: AAA family ATPase [Myxococcales bacterium]|nr:AAA family ATPase [Myxococcales bacterium]